MLNGGAHEDSKIKKPDSGYLKPRQDDIKVRDKIQNLELASQQQNKLFISGSEIKQDPEKPFISGLEMKQDTEKPFISGSEIKEDPEKPFISGSEMKQDTEKPFISGSQIKQDPEKLFISGSQIREDLEKPKPVLIVPTTSIKPVEKVIFNHRQEYIFMGGAWRLKNLISTIFIFK